LVATLAALGVAGVAIFFEAARPWLLGLSVAFLAVGFYQVRSGLRCGVRGSRIGLGLLALATVVLLLVGLFPQLVAGLLADWME
jgi:hypothetical protein